METTQRTFPTAQLSAVDKKQLGQYQRPKYDPQTGLVWIEDGTAGVSHSAHPNVEANRFNRRKYQAQGWVESHGFLFSPEVFRSTELDHLAARYCRCNGCHMAKAAR